MRPCMGVWARLQGSVTPSYFQPREATRLALRGGYNASCSSPHLLPVSFLCKGSSPSWSNYL